MRPGAARATKITGMVATWAVFWLAAVAHAAPVVINEIHFSPPDKRPLEFVELHNPNPQPVSLADWSLNRFRFPTNAVIKPGDFLVVALDPGAFEAEFGFHPLGPFPGKLKSAGGLRLQDAQGRLVDEVNFGTGFPWPTAAAGGGSSLERIHPASPGNSPGSWRGSGFPTDTTRRVPPASLEPGQPTIVPRWQRPTPGATNSAFTPDPPPAAVSVEHHPEQPKSGEPVLVTVRVADPRGVTNALLRIQVVEPGRYARRSDNAYATNWLDFPMQPGSAAQPGVFNATVPGEFQQHRRLLRYRLTLTGPGGRSVQLPYPDDEVPNFAWFVYDGLPAWTGASVPGRPPTLTFPPPMLGTLPVYHLLARAEDVSRSQWNGAFNRRPFYATLVYDGRVYDHIRFHNRGQASAYEAGKNKWGFKFNRGHYLAARDDYGRLYQAPWNNLNLNACASPWVQMNRGMAGMDEALSFRSYQLAGVPAANTHWLHFRVISSAAESSAQNQYQGDLWGLYLAVQSMDGAWLDDLGLPSGNVYSLQSGRKHLARGMPADGSDWGQFQSGMRQAQKETWWRTNLNLPAFYSFHALNRLLSNVDLREEGNHGFYHAPDGRWAPVPWDNDMMFIPHSHQSGVIAAVRCLRLPPLRLEFKNRAREILDLFVSDPAPNGGQFAQLVDEYARLLCPPGQPRTWPELDMALWNYNPHSTSRGEFYVNPSFRGWSGLPFRRVLDTPDFAGFCRYIVNFCTDSRPAKNYQPDDNNPVGYGWGYLSWEARDDNIPATPSVTYAGPAGFPATNLAFAISPFASSQFLSQAAFAAVQWRVAEIRAPGLAGYLPEHPYAYELTARWQSDERANPAPACRLPDDACPPGHTYRVRARYQDSTGRWSHWSAPVQFVTAKR